MAWISLRQNCSWKPIYSPNRRCSFFQHSENTPPSNFPPTSRQDPVRATFDWQARKAVNAEVVDPDIERFPTGRIHMAAIEARKTLRRVGRRSRELFDRDRQMAFVQVRVRLDPVNGITIID